MTAEELRPHAGNVIPEVHHPASSPWKKLKHAVMHIERLAFGLEGAETKKDMRGWFKDEKNIIVLLKSAQGALLGYTIAIPFDNPKLPKDLEERRGKPETAYVYSTAIVEQFRGRGLIAPLMTRLDEELRSRGYKYVERHAEVENGYADSLERYYGERVVEREDEIHEIYGLQRFLRIRL